MMKKTQVFQFPILDVQSVVAFAVEMEGDVEEKHLLNPTFEVIWPLYESMARYILTLSREEVQQPAFDKWCKLEHPEMHEESTGIFAAWKSVRELMFAAGVTDISLRDILKPDSSRTIRFLSGLINFARFRKEKEEKIVEMQEESLPEKRQLLEESIAKAKHDLASMEAEREDQIPELQRLEEENNELWQDIITLNKTQVTLQRDNNALKQELTSITHSISGQNYMLQQAKQEGSALRGRLVESMEKLGRSLEETKGTLVITETGAEEARKCLHRWKQKLESYTKVEKKIQKLLGLSAEAQKLLSTQKTASKEVKALKSKIKANEEVDLHRKAKLADLSLKGQHWQDLIGKAEHLSLVKTKEEERILHDVRVQHASFRKKQQTVKVTIAKNKTEMQFLGSETADVLKTKDKKIQWCREEVASIQKQVLKYYRSILARAPPAPKLSN